MIRRKARHIADAGCCAQTNNTPRVQAKPDAFPVSPFPHLLHNLRAHVTVGHCNHHDWQQQTTIQKPALTWIFQAFQRFLPRPRSGLSDVLPTISDGFCFFPRYLLGELDRKIPHPCPRPLSLPRGLSLLDSQMFFFKLLSPGSFLCNGNTAFPIHSLQFPCGLLGRRRASLRQPAAVPTAQTQYALKARCVPTSSTRNVNSSAPSLMVASGKSSLNFFFVRKLFGASTQVTHVHRTTTVCLGESSWPVHDASSACFVQARDKALNRAITIVLLARQQL